MIADPIRSGAERASRLAAMHCKRKVSIRYSDGRIRTVCGQPLRYVRRCHELGATVHVYTCGSRHELTIAVRR